jgi:holo-[acyl-carrier-protein] synthase
VIVGVGLDVAGIERFGQALERTPMLVERIFVERELALPDGEPRGVASLAARFAAKEALAKALGAPGGLSWHDAEVPAGRRCPYAGRWRRARRRWECGAGICRCRTTRGSRRRS